MLPGLNLYSLEASPEPWEHGRHISSLANRYDETVPFACGVWSSSATMRAWGLALLSRLVQDDHQRVCSVRPQVRIYRPHSGWYR